MSLCLLPDALSRQLHELKYYASLGAAGQTLTEFYHRTGGIGLFLILVQHLEA